MLNQVCVMGRLVREPELRSTQGGISVTSITLAIDRDYGGKGEEKQTDFIDVVCWRQTAEFVAKYFRKGSMMAVSGRLQSRRWEDKDGGKRTTVEIVADNCYFGERKSESGGNSGFGGTPSDFGAPPPERRGSGGGTPAQSPAGASYDFQSAGSFSEMDDDDGEVPF